MEIKPIKKFKTTKEFVKDRDRVHRKIEEDRNEKKPIVYKLSDKNILLGKEIKEIARSYPINLDKYRYKIKDLSAGQKYLIVPNSWLPCYVEYENKIMYISHTFLPNSMYLVPNKSIEGQHYLMKVYRYNNVFLNQEQLDYSSKRYENHLKSYAKKLFDLKKGVKIENL